MTRSDWLALFALVLAVAGLLLPRPAPPPSMGPPPPEPRTDVYAGQLYLEPQGEACKLVRKSPDPVRVKAGAWVFWTVHNGCTREAALRVLEIQRNPNNRSKQDDPFTAVFGGPIPPNTNTEVVVWKIKTTSELDPGPGSGPDRWTFKWRVNNAVQQDPELEIDY